MLIKGKAMTAECVQFDRPKTWTLAGEIPNGKAGLDGRVETLAKGTVTPYR